MIDFKSFTLDNGLKVIFHQDKTTPLAVMNVLYDVGAKDEDENKTGFAHLFEHLMFGGSKNIPSYDTPLQRAGGECNAFTSNDITNYYDILPAQNIETAFWLESDRMLELAFTDKSLEVQRGVVIEEFKQRYLNQPYGDVWLQFRPLIYKTHPYKWATIGKSIEHIEDAKMEDVKAFFYKHYSPQNAIVVIGGNLELEQIKILAQKYFGRIPARENYVRNILPELPQTDQRRITIERDVPSDAIYIAFRMGGRASAAHYLGDLCSDILAGSKSSRLYNLLILKTKMMSSISAYITGSIEEGLLLISGNLNEGVSFEDVESAIWKELDLIMREEISQNELTKVKNKLKTRKVFSEQTLLNRVMNIAFFENMGILDELNDDLSKYDAIQGKDILNFAKKTFTRSQSSTLLIQAKR
ncbi:insulinase family protein [Crocinitomix sp.]|nr:insulinase family protein [Crocinitomix sp.]